MIHVLFVPGMFGTTVEYVLRSFTKEYVSLDKVPVCNDGSMHNFGKELHPLQRETIAEFFNTLQSDSITTPIYPFPNDGLTDIIDAIKQYSSSYDTDKRVLIHASSLQGAELNVLFQYHKIAFGEKINLGLTIFCNNNSHNVIKWNPDYTSWKDMQPWELREWFSLFYVEWVQEWINSQNQVEDAVLKIDHRDILDNFLPTMSTIIKHCGLTETSELEDFAREWRSKQQYIVDEYNLLAQIVDSSINCQLLSWEPINVIAEAIVQQRLRALGYEIRCDGLNTFPTDSKTLYNLLEKV